MGQDSVRTLGPRTKGSEGTSIPMGTLGQTGYSRFVFRRSRKDFFKKGKENFLYSMLVTPGWKEGGRRTNLTTTTTTSGDTFGRTGWNSEEQCTPSGLGTSSVYGGDGVLKDDEKG